MKLGFELSQPDPKKPGSKVTAILPFSQFTFPRTVSKALCYQVSIHPSSPICFIISTSLCVPAIPSCFQGLYYPKLFPTSGPLHIWFLLSVTLFLMYHLTPPYPSELSFTVPFLTKRTFPNSLSKLFSYVMLSHCILYFCFI